MKGFRIDINDVSFKIFHNTILDPLSVHSRLPNYLQIQLKLAGGVVGIFFLGGGAVTARISILFYQFYSEIKKRKRNYSCGLTSGGGVFP